MEKKQYRILGLMSGTSLDGLDIVQCVFHWNKDKWEYSIENAKTYSYPNDFKKKLANAENLSGLGLCLLSNEFAKVCSDFIQQFLFINKSKVDFIASHGQTIFHQPNKKLTVQIGNGAIICAETGITTICDFRTTDVALGGNGAPLVPIGDKLLFNQYDYCLNLGGFANISFDDDSGKRIAFDICPVNIVINELVREIDLDFDKNGEIARNGNLNESLLTELNNIDFYSQLGPKSLGKEWVVSFFIPILKKYDISLEDKLRTLYQHITNQIGAKCIKKDSKVLVTGGGAHNIFLMELFRNEFQSEIVIPQNEIVDFKEALLFAFLGLKRFLNQPNCLASVTGAKFDNVGGAIYLGDSELKL